LKYHGRGGGISSANNSPVALFPDKIFDELGPPRVEKRWGEDGDDIIHVPTHVSLPSRHKTQTQTQTQTKYFPSRPKPTTMESNTKC
jgi:hypothetical protein